MFNFDFRTSFKPGDRVFTCGEDKLLGGRVAVEAVTITKVKNHGPFKYEGRYDDGEKGLFMEDELTSKPSR